MQKINFTIKEKIREKYCPHLTNVLFGGKSAKNKYAALKKR